MIQRVIHLDVHRTALVCAICGAIVSLFFMVLPMAMYFLFSLPQKGFYMGMIGGGTTIVLMPVFYIFGALSVIVFNLVAPRVGGIAMTVLVEVEPGSDEAGRIG